MESLIIKNFGPIEEVNVKFGDLTFLVGPQASGKSLFLELLKYIVDKEFVLSNLRKYNYIIDKKNPQKVLDTFFGDGIKYLNLLLRLYIMDKTYRLILYKREMSLKRSPCSIYQHNAY